MPTSVRLSESIEQRLSFLATQTGRTKAFYIREMIESNLGNMEELYLAEQVSLRVKQGIEPTYSLDELENKLDMES
ncbi:MAG: CopG family transcriptional regulator [Rivularia sp. ALOHA_DT_140]|nr:CopG family transcriptional regulator [Rivularia sp. ALOHA_DT_140]